MVDQFKSVVIGLFVIAACVIIIMALLFLHPTVGDNRRVLRVRFTDIDKITEGTRVTFAGKPVGEVVEIKEIEDVRDRRTDFRGDVYVYELILRVDSGVNVYNSDTISARTSGLLGEKSIAINPEPIRNGDSLKLVNDEVIYAEQIGGVEDTFKEFSNVSAKVEEVLNSVNQFLQEIKEKEIVEKFAETIQNLDDITEALNKPELWTEILENFRMVSQEFSQRVPQSWDKLDKALNDIGGASTNARMLTEEGHKVVRRSHGIVTEAMKAFKKFNGITDNIAIAAYHGAEVGEKIHTIVAHIGQGKGSLGEIIIGNDLYLRLASLLSKGNRIMDDVQTYGILFQNNKKWQRIQACRLNLMNKLSDSEKFSYYFANELNQISTSLSQVSMLLEETERQEACPQLCWNPCFTASLAELLQQVETFEDSLQMYNQQLLDNCCQ